MKNFDVEVGVFRFVLVLHSRTLSENLYSRTLDDDYVAILIP